MRGSGMIQIHGGTFQMGSQDHYPEEQPVRAATIASFEIDETPVTNAAFQKFVAATHYKTFAERLPDPKQYRGISPQMLQAGSIVFRVPSRRDVVPGPESWWHFVVGADWQHPYGPGSDIAALADHPVVHIVWEDACAYASWANTRLPTEAEAEFAARGGLNRATYAWGEELMPNGQLMANIWVGDFPFRHAALNGPPYTTAVRRFPANGFGLFDTIGNVWEWTSTHADGVPGNNQCCGASGALTFRKVLKGGSHLCASNYCRRYRPAAKWFQPVDTSTSHVGFRCARSIGSAAD